MTENQKHNLDLVAERLAKSAAQAREWWESTGKAIWAARIDLPDFHDKHVAVIRFEQRGEQHMATVYYGWQEEFLKVQIGGMVDDKRAGLMYTFGWTTYTDFTLETALYMLLH